MFNRHTYVVPIIEWLLMKIDTELIQRIREIYSREGLTTLFAKGYQKYSPRPLKFRYGVKKTLSHPDLLIGHVKSHMILEFNKIYHDFFGDSYKGENVMGKDWDNLIILDGCRFDHFEDVNCISGELHEAISVASNTPNFLDRTFSGGKFTDTVYISGNTHSRKFDDGTFHDIVCLDDEKWDDKLFTVPPHAITKAAQAAFDQYPQKRLIVHYMQPHTPWIGEKGQKFIDEKGLRDLRDAKNNRPETNAALRYNAIEFEDEELEEIYTENLNIVLEEVEDLIESLEGKTVISADHGELLGESTSPIPVKGYGHPALPHPHLRKVPWFIVESGPRRENISEDPVNIDHIDTANVEDCLKALGYK